MANTRIFKTRRFSIWLRKQGIDDRSLIDAAFEIQHGLVDAELGAGLLKKRVPLRGRGKRGGGRAIVATDKGMRLFYLLGYAKNNSANLGPRELKALESLAAELLTFNDEQLNLALRHGSLIEIEHEAKALH